MQSDILCFAYRKEHYGKVKNGFLKGALTISAGTFIAKVLGAIYRIPLTNIIGVGGIGLYQMAFPLYTVMLTFSCMAVPNALSKLIAGGKDARVVLKKSLRFFCVVGIIGCLFMEIFARKLSLWQGDKRATLCYALIAPSVFFTAILSCYRGYFQGLAKMLPTALTQIVEQSVKLAVGLALAYFFRKNVVLSAGACAFAVSVSEIVATLVIYIKYKRSNFNLHGESATLSQILKVLIPITLAGIIIPLVKFADSFLIINLLKRYSPNSTELYGLYSGGVESVVGVPVALCYGFAVASIPLVAKAVASGVSPFGAIRKIYAYTLAFGTVFCICVFIFSPLAVRVLYFRLSPYDKRLLTGLVACASFGIIFLSLTQTLNSVFWAMGKLYTPCVSMGIGAIVKVIVLVALVKTPDYGIYGAVLSDLAFYSVSALLNTVKLFGVQSTALSQPVKV